MKPVDLAAQGWRIPYPAEFLPVSQVARTMAHGDAVSQLVLSDGLAAISVFIEPYDKSAIAISLNGAYRRGPINVYGMRIADFWVTVLGEVPAPTLEQLAKATEYVPPPWRPNKQQTPQGLARALNDSVHRVEITRRRFFFWTAPGHRALHGPSPGPPGPGGAAGDAPCWAARH